MTAFADGGAIADWSLAADWFVAIGTVAAASVALWLGLRARGDEATRHHEERRRVLRQLIGVFHPRDDRTGSAPFVRVVNGGSEIVSELLLMVTFGRARGSAPVWEFNDGRLEKQIDFLLPGSTEVFQGQFWPTGRAGLDHRRSVDPESDDEIDVLLVWRDAFGDVWARVGNSEPYQSTFAVPGRSLENIVREIAANKRSDSRGQMRSLLRRR